MNDSTKEDTGRRSWWQRLTGGLKRTSSSLGTALSDLVTKRKLDAAMLEEIEEALIRADLGVATAGRVTQALGEGRYDKAISVDEVKTVLASEVEKILTPVAKPLLLGTQKPFVLLVVGVNGSGKTTTIGKLAAKFHADGKKVMLAAGDTFRAAAREQLTVWGERNNVTVVSQESGDAAAVIFDAVGAARARKIDVMMADTAGRLPTQLHLMEELRKVKRVIAKAQPDAPHEVLLVIDANTGQNALAQVKSFDDALGLTGLIVTKLDGTAKGGILAAIARQRPIPVYFIGVGEKVEDLQPFSADEFADALLGN
jgi:fused signal recognition particle receptor